MMNSKHRQALKAGLLLVGVVGVILVIANWSSFFGKNGASEEGALTQVTPRISRTMEYLSESPATDLQPTQVTVSVAEADDQSPRDLVDAKLKPGSDDFETEVLAEAVADSLKKVAGFLSGDELLPKNFEETLAESLSPVRLKKVFEGDGLMASRMTEGTTDLAPLADRLRDLRQRFPGDRITQVKFKVVGIHPLEKKFRADIRSEFYSASGEKSLQVTTKWKSVWTSSKAPRLEVIEVVEYEEVKVANAGKTPRGFSEVTEAVLSQNRCWTPQIRRGLNHWGERISRLNNLQFDGHSGIAVGDVNGDGRDDLYVCETGGLPNRLFVQQEDGTAKDLSHEAGVDWLENSRSAIFLDFDNDGDQDLAVATISLLLFMENDGKGNFALKGGVPEIAYPFSMSASDYDGDGLVDLYVCNYSALPTDPNQRDSTGSAPTPYNDARNGGRNVLLKNLGGFRFLDVAAECGLDQNNTRWSFAASWEDYDNDGDPDLYVANDFGRNNLYRNDGGTFADIAAEAGVEDMATGMSASWGDFDRDGHMDIYVSNMFSSAGNRIAFQRRFLDRLQTPADAIQRMARGNSLFSGSESGSFRDVSESSAVTMGRWAWGSQFVDLNNDGNEDLVVANGYLTNRLADDL